MKKFFETLGIISLMICSFWYTDKTASVMKEKDDIMVAIKKAEEKEIIDINEAIITNDTIIPGVHTSQIDENRSYNKMKEIGYFDNSFLIYKNVNPKILLEQNYDKYIISGNKKKNNISFLFKIHQNTTIHDVKRILTILNKKRIKSDFFVDGYFLEENNDLMYDIIRNGHQLQNLSYKEDYTNPSFLWLDAVLKKLNHQKVGYCYLENKDKKTLNICSTYKNHVIIPNLVLEHHALATIKKNIKSGNLISITINSQVIDELPIIIDYIKSRGYKITLLKEHLKE